MNRVIQFPNQQQRRTLKQQKFVQKKQKVANKFFAFVKMCLLELSYFLHVIAADILHYPTVLFFNLIYKFHKPIIFVLYGMCIVSYFHLGRAFVTANDVSIPALLLMSLVVVSGKTIAYKIQMKQPFHYLLRCKRPRDEMEIDENKEYIILEKTSSFF